jgi:ABC-2 type transport system permease protein
MRAPAGTSQHGARPGASLAWRQVGYQLLLLSRSPLGTFTVLVVPLMLLGALSIVNPQDSLKGLGHPRYADFLTPAMATFALLNACYINVATSVVTAREAGVLKRLHTSPLPLWAYVVGRIGAAGVVGGVAFWVVMLAGWLFLDVRLDAARVGYLAAVMLLGVVCFSLLGLALSTVVGSTDSALPVAYGTFLPTSSSRSATPPPPCATSLPPSRSPPSPGRSSGSSARTAGR